MLTNKRIFCTLLIFIMVAVLLPWKAEASTAKKKYFQAEGHYKKLRNNSAKQKLRENWLLCIEKFNDVYRHDPSGQWAPAGLYMAGELYKQLYKRSTKTSDIIEARDIFQRVVKRFPRSLYKKRAMARIAEISKMESTKKQTKKAYSKKKDENKTASPREKFVEAENRYNKLRKDSKKRKYRHNWLRSIEMFQTVYQIDPTGQWAAAGLYMSGKLYAELFRYSGRHADKEESIDLFQKIVSDFSRSAYKPKAVKELKHFGISVPWKAADTKKKSSVAKSTQSPPSSTEKKDDAEDIIATTARVAQNETIAADVPVTDVGHKDNSTSDGGPVTISGLRFWSNPSYTRVVVDADDETHYNHRLLKKDPALNKPQRLFVDLKKSRLGKDIQKVIPINDNMLLDARAGQYTADMVRVVIDIKSFDTYKTFSLKNPFRVVIDVWRKTGSTVAKSDSKSSTLSTGALAKQLSLGVSKIVIDAGHGGRDYGAPGYLKGVHEKHITLQLAKRLAKKIRSRLGCEVIMTRTSDRFLSLEERTAIANTKMADLFISIHTNAVRNRKAYGIETFFLNLATDDDAIMVAARENATSKKNISDLQTILSDLMQNAKINESSNLAGHVQKSLCNHLKKGYSKIKNKGVKQAPFYVLLGAQMPAILIETSFISSPRECKRLVDTKYQDQLCQGILNGIERYIDVIKPVALQKKQFKQDGNS
jgi:N-acetylmuramoyl-L-alanine amidase